MGFWLVAAAAAAVYWWLSLRDGHGWGRSVTKGLAVAPLAVMALAQNAPLLALALALYSLGDVILSRPGQAAFLGGLIAFALGHLAWIAVFVTGAGLRPELLLEPIRLVLVLALVVLTVTMARVLLPRAGAVKSPVAVYLVIILVMVITALASPPVLITVGVVLFAASDSLLGLQTFALEQGARRERAVNALIWPLYWAAIASLALGTMA